MPRLKAFIQLVASNFFFFFVLSKFNDKLVLLGCGPKWIYDCLTYRLQEVESEWSQKTMRKNTLSKYYKALFLENCINMNFSLFLWTSWLSQTNSIQGSACGSIGYNLRIPRVSVHHSLNEF